MNEAASRKPSPGEGRCPRCGKRFAYRSIQEHKPFPFCSPRCRDVDLGNWLTEKYVVPGAAAPAPEPEPDPGDD
ncbi:MAG: DNA gyrase inhibitor YacG [Planctomycetota bacterium]|nr:DNA gyrase inhibitor YacG [Planctomycetota bacterium]